MAKLPAFQFYPGDWMKDPDLRLCSPAARGVWVDMLCLMFECEERGVLASGGRPWSDKQVAAVISGDTQEVLSCIAELLDKGVVSRNASGSLFSRRMVRDENRRKSTRVRVQKHRGNGDVTADVTQFVTPRYEDEDEVPVVEVGFSVEEFDGDFAFRDFCGKYPKSDESAIAQNEFMKAIESIVTGQHLKNRRDAYDWLCARTAVYLKLVPTKFQASMVNYLNRRIFNQKDSAWRQDGSKTDERQRQGFDAIGAALAKRTGGPDGRHAETVSGPTPIEGAGRRLHGRLDDAGK